MNNILHITSGDCAGEVLQKSGLPGELLVWHDVLYDGPRNPGWPDSDSLKKRAQFLEEMTAGGMSCDHILEILNKQYERLGSAAQYERIVLWFDACLFDQSMLVHLLMLLDLQQVVQVDLLCIDSFPGIEPFDGLGQLQPQQLASLYDKRRPVSDAQFQFGAMVDRAFALQDLKLLTKYRDTSEPPLPWIPAAITRWLLEQPDPASGLGRLHQLVLLAVASGCEKPVDIYSYVAAHDSHPQYWGDITLWAKINDLAERFPQLVQIEGPAERLPQWQSNIDLNKFIVRRLSAL